MNELIEYNMSDDLQKDLYGIIENAQQTAIVSVNSVLVIRKVSMKPLNILRSFSATFSRER